jgi:lipopolysaccharide biosynthesis regulator YciM
MKHNDWQKAISIAAKFPRLGDAKVAIERAQMAYTNPRFLVQLGRNVEKSINDGITALNTFYPIKQ